MCVCVCVCVMCVCVAGKDCQTYDVIVSSKFFDIIQVSEHRLVYKLLLYVYVYSRKCCIYNYAQLCICFCRRDQ